jgi:hypothetical protein
MNNTCCLENYNVINSNLEVNVDYPQLSVNADDNLQSDSLEDYAQLSSSNVDSNSDVHSSIGEKNYRISPFQRP